MDTTVLSVMSFNIWGLPFVRLSLTDDLDARLEGMIGPIRELDPDIIAFQEVWSDAIWEHFVETLDYPFFAYRPNRGLLRGRLGNGLLILSRYPLARERVRRFSTFTRGHEYFTNKGALLVDVLTPHGPVTLVNTHLGSGFRATVEQRRLSQCGELLRWISEVPRDQPVILAGDLNLCAGSERYRELLQWIRACFGPLSGDSFEQANPGRPGFTHYVRRLRKGGAVNGNHGARIDYILVLCSQESALRLEVHESEVVFDTLEVPLSDHCAVLTRMEIGPSPMATPIPPSIFEVDTGSVSYLLNFSSSENV